MVNAKATKRLAANTIFKIVDSVNYLFGSYPRLLLFAEPPEDPPPRPPRTSAGKPKTPNAVKCVV